MIIFVFKNLLYLYSTNNNFEKETNTMDLSKYPMNYRTREETKSLLESVTSLRVNELIKKTENIKKQKEEEKKKKEHDIK